MYSTFSPIHYMTRFSAWTMSWSQLTRGNNCRQTATQGLMAFTNCRVPRYCTLETENHCSTFPLSRFCKNTQVITSFKYIMTIRINSTQIDNDILNGHEYVFINNSIFSNMLQHVKLYFGFLK